MVEANKEENLRDDLPFPSFPNFTWDMYDGNAPCGSGGKLVDGRDIDRWSTRYGDGESVDGVIRFGKFSINHKITIYIAYEHLSICDIRYAGDTRCWEYSNDGAYYTPEHVRMKLEPEKIEKILNTEIDCKFWEMMKARAVELMEGNHG